jgi:hypothetical protein
VWVVVIGWGWRLLLVLFVDDITHLLFVILDGGGSFHFMRGYSCVCIGTELIKFGYKLRASFLQVSCKFCFETCI